MNKTLIVALAAIGLPLAGCTDNEAAEAVTPATDAPVVEEPAVVAEPVDPALAPEAETTLDPMTEEPMMEEGTTAPVEGDTPVEGEEPATDGTQM